VKFRRGKQTGNVSQPTKSCSSCNNEVGADWKTCVYCGSILIDSMTHPTHIPPEEKVFIEGGARAAGRLVTRGGDSVDRLN
jgi:hypothetical protein